MLRIPSPQELNFPEKYERWRPNQEDFIRRGLTETVRNIVTCAPTGFGKLACIIAIALISKKPTCIVTRDNGLIQQALDEFGHLGLTALLGRGNYVCGMREDWTCEDGYPAQCPYKGTPMCPASQAEMRSTVSYLVITNYSKWTSSKKFGQGMAHFEQVIFDECHYAYEAISSAMQVRLNQKEIERTLGVDFLDEPDDFKPWKQWAVTTRTVADEELTRARRKIIVHQPKLKDIRHFFHMRNLLRRLNTLATAPANSWIVDQFKSEHSEGFQFDPISPGRYIEPALLFRIEKAIWASATVRPKTMYISGVSKDNFSFVEYDSSFDPKRHPVYWVPTMRVDKNNPDLSMLWLRIDQAAARRQDRKGIIHTISYARRDEIVNRSRFAEKMIINQRGEPTIDMIDDFRMAGPGSLLISPVVGTGYDFKDDFCRWQVVLKVPFEPPSKIGKARAALDKEYAPYRAMQYLVQAFGRDCRSETDWSEGLIFDNNFGEWFYPKYAHLAPRSFHAVYRGMTMTLPQPLML